MPRSTTYMLARDPQAIDRLNNRHIINEYCMVTFWLTHSVRAELNAVLLSLREAKFLTVNRLHPYTGTFFKETHSPQQAKHFSVVFSSSDKFFFWRLRSSLLRETRGLRIVICGRSWSKAP